MAHDVEAAQPTIRAHIALRIAISVSGFDRRLQLAEQTGPAASRQFTFARWRHRARADLNKRDRRNEREVRDSRADQARQGCNRDSRRSREIFPKRWPDTAHSW